MISRHTLFIALAGLMTSHFMSCSKKEPAAPPANKKYIRSVTVKSATNSLVAVGDQVSFTGKIDLATLQGTYPSNFYYTHAAVAGYKFVWDFGDGHTDTFKNENGIPSHDVSHVYTAAGTYNVALVCDDTLRSQPLVVNVCADPGYTHQICTQRRWTGGQFQRNSDTPISLPDSTFALTYTDKISIDLWGHRYVYSPSSSSAAMLQFGEGNTYIRYYPARDSINLFDVRNGSASSGQLVPVYKVWYHTR